MKSWPGLAIDWDYMSVSEARLIKWWLDFKSLTLDTNGEWTPTQLALKWKTHHVKQREYWKTHGTKKMHTSFRDKLYW